MRDYYKTIGITLPDFDREDGWWGTEQELYLDNFESAGFSKVCSSAPEELKAFELLAGDVILMQIRSKRVNHAAVYIGDGKIIHHMYGKLSKPDVYGGFWLRNTRLIVRHESNIRR
ncbi:NlpC/P60 family protein [Vibrio furnissii]|uniref:NlpC/P60 family protein n=1 Tax=Vibrio furnissii TaxID=29494 RepID=UPI003747E185